MATKGSVADKDVEAKSFVGTDQVFSLQLPSPAATVRPGSSGERPAPDILQDDGGAGEDT